jgi:hypothetical protein
MNETLHDKDGKFITFCFNDYKLGQWNSLHIVLSTSIFHLVLGLLCVPSLCSV